MGGCQESMKGLEAGLGAARGLGCGAQKDFRQGARCEWGMAGCGHRGLFVPPSGQWSRCGGWSWGCDITAVLGLGEPHPAF